jgi:hypothetical protein
MMMRRRRSRSECLTGMEKNSSSTWEMCHRKEGIRMVVRSKMAMDFGCD